MPFDTERNAKMDFLWHKSEACHDLKGHQKSAAYIIALRIYDSVPQNLYFAQRIFIFLSGKRNSLMDFPFAWMSN